MKLLSRKKKYCNFCRDFGHKTEDCPEIDWENPWRYTKPIAYLDPPWLRKFEEPKRYYTARDIKVFIALTTVFWLLEIAYCGFVAEVIVDTNWWKSSLVALSTFVVAFILVVPILFYDSRVREKSFIKELKDLLSLRRKDVV